MERGVKTSRSAARLRETAPTYAEEARPPQPLGFRVAVADRGRIVLPAEVRDRLKIKDGDSLTLSLEPDGVIRLFTAETWTDTFIKMMRHLARHIPPGRRLSDELIAERRRDAAKEERERQKTMAWLRRRKP